MTNISVMLLVHILAGGMGLVSGAVALSAAKGAGMHRRSGRLFVYAMLTMTVTGAILAIGQRVGVAVNLPAALLAGYLVITAMTAVQPPAAALRRLDAGLMLAGFAVGLASLASGFGVIAAGGRESGMAFPLFMFAVVGLLAAAGDFRMLRSGGLRGAARLARHLWRMCVALWIAAASFFLGQADEFPEALRIPGLLALPVLAVLVAMFYWLWRVRGGWLAGGRQGLQVP